MTEVQETAAKLERTAAPQPVQAKRPNAAALARHAPPSKGKALKKAGRANKPDKDARSAKPAKPHASRGSKTDKVVAMLKRPGGATGADLMKATGWQAHSVRGFISGVLGRRMGFKVNSEFDNGQRRYSLKA